MNKTMLGVIAALLTLILFAVVGFGVYFATRESDPLKAAANRARAARDEEAPKLEEARKGALRLSEACKRYQEMTGEFPASLADLVDRPGGGVPLVKPTDLIDPWKKPYQYDPTGERSGRGDGAFDVWAVSPSGQEARSW
jgi:hypothetical protein